MATLEDVVGPGHADALALFLTLAEADHDDLRPLLAAMMSGWLTAMRAVDMPETSAEAIREALIRIKTREAERHAEQAEADAQVGASVDVEQPRRGARGGPRGGGIHPDFKNRLGPIDRPMPTLLAEGEDAPQPAPVSEGTLPE